MWDKRAMGTREQMDSEYFKLGEPMLPTEEQVSAYISQLFCSNLNLNLNLDEII